MKKIGLQLSFVTLLFTVLSVSCEKDTVEDKKLEFSKFFEKIMINDESWAQNYSHELENGQIINSTQNLMIYGKFGNEILEVTHITNAENIVTSSDIKSNLYKSNNFRLNYEYDSKGYIIKLTKSVENQVQDIINIEYNDKNQLVRKEYEISNNNDKLWEENFEYNEDDKIKSYYNSKGDYSFIYNYLNGNMEKVVNPGLNDRDFNSKFKYDDLGRITERKDGWALDWVTRYEYSDSVFKIFEYNNGNLIWEWIIGGKLKSKQSAYYIFESSGSNVVKYCRETEFNENGNIIKKRIYDGTYGKLNLLGYGIIDSRDELTSLVTKQSIYDKNGKLLYYIEYIINDGQIDERIMYKSDESIISYLDWQNIPEDWVSWLEVNVDNPYWFNH